jgi:purine-cytosine permease-like protein
LVSVGAATVFIPFLMTLGLTLPPLAAVLILSHFLAPEMADARASAMAATCWLTGTLVGVATTRGAFALSGLPVIDSIAATAAAFVLIHLARKRRAFEGAKSSSSL